MIRYWLNGIILLCMAIVFVAHGAGVFANVALSSAAPDCNSQYIQPVANKHVSVTSAHADPSEASSGCGAMAGTAQKGATPCPPSGLVAHADDFNVVPINSLRFINLVLHDVLEVQPVYLLAHDFTSYAIPPVERVRGMPRHVDWTLSAISSPARISGWKASNLQYRFSQQSA
ncbi:MAG: hypothetical protein ACRCXH_01045 [Shewanella sp.]